MEEYFESDFRRDSGIEVIWFRIRTSIVRNKVKATEEGYLILNQTKDFKMNNNRII